MSLGANLLRSVALLSLVPAARGQQMPSQLAVTKLSSAKTVFVVNQGAESDFSFDIPGGANVCYNEFYASLKQAGNFELVEDPGHADLIMAIHCTEQREDVVDDSRGIHEPYSYTQYPPFLNLTVLDPENMAPLYVIRTFAGRASNVPKGEIAMANSINGLTAKVMAIVGKTQQLPAPEMLIKAVGPVPPQVLEAKKIFLIGATAQYDLVTSLTAALNAWGHYTIVDSPQQADIMLVIDDGHLLTAKVYTPSEEFQLWTVTDPHFKGYGLRGKKLILAKVANMMRAFKTLNGEP